jgi:hypothetical protein
MSVGDAAIQLQSAEFLCRASHADVNCVAPHHVVLLDNSCDTVRIIEFNDPATATATTATTSPLPPTATSTTTADNNSNDGSSGGSASALNVSQKIVSKDVSSRLRLSPPSSSCVPNNLSLIGQYCCLRHDTVFVSIFDLNAANLSGAGSIDGVGAAGTSGAVAAAAERKAQWLATLDFGGVFVGGKGGPSTLKRTDLAIFGNGTKNEATKKTKSKNRKICNDHHQQSCMRAIISFLFRPHHSELAYDCVEFGARRVGLGDHCQRRQRRRRQTHWDEHVAAAVATRVDRCADRGARSFVGPCRLALSHRLALSRRVVQPPNDFDLRRCAKRRAFPPHDVARRAGRRAVLSLDVERRASRHARTRKKSRGKSPLALKTPCSLCVPTRRFAVHNNAGRCTRMANNVDQSAAGELRCRSLMCEHLWPSVY